MTQAFNLSQLANKVNTSGQLDVSTGSTGTLPVANGGTNNGSLAVTAGGALYTDGSKVVNVGAGTSGQLLQSNGASAPTWVAPPASGFSNREYITASTTWTVPAGITKARVTVIGGGGGGGDNTGNGGCGGAAVAVLTGLSGSVSVTIGGGGAGSNTGNGSAGGTTSFGSFLSATGGAGGLSATGGFQNCGTGTVSSGTTLFRTVTSKLDYYMWGYLANLIPGGYRKFVGTGGPAAWSTSSIYAAGALGAGESGQSSGDVAGGMNGAVIVEY